MTHSIRSVCERADQLGESPVWDAQEGCLYWVDGVSRLVRRLDPKSGSLREWQTPSVVGSVGLATERRLVVGLVDGIHLLDTATGELAPVFRPEPVDPAIRFNDGKVDRFGRFVCGSMGIHADPRGQLWRIDVSGGAVSFADGIRISNAICFSPVGDVMYFADSLERRIRAYAYGPGDDVDRSFRILVDTAEWNSGPDGATVDAEGCIWVTLVQVGKLARFTPDGRLDRLIDAPTDMPSCLAFGGYDLSTLYVTSIKDSGSGRAISKHPDGGRLFAIDGLGVKGLPEPRFGAAPAAAKITMEAR